NALQTCICAMRIFVHLDIADHYTTRFIEKVNVLAVGNGFQEDVKIRSLVYKAADDKSKTHVTDGEAKGWKLSLIGDDIQDTKGNFLIPVVISNVNLDMKVMHEETFGPVAPVMVYEDLDEAIKMANDTEFGLASYFFTNDYRTGLKLYNE